jgi:hypothetical protein
MLVSQAPVHHSAPRPTDLVADFRNDVARRKAQQGDAHFPFPTIMGSLPTLEYLVIGWLY